MKMLDRVDKIISKKIAIGEKLVAILKLREDYVNRKSYFPKRYITNWGSKTALGIYETVKRILDDKGV